MFMSASTDRTGSAPAAADAPLKPVVQAPRRTSFFQSDTFPPVAGYINRATYLLSRGRPAAEIGVYFPTLSMWYGDNVSNTSLLDISRQLMENQRDFDFVDEQSLTSILTVENAQLVNASNQAYKVIIIPSVSAMSAEALKKLKQFADSGGKVIFMGNLPAMVIAGSFLDATEYNDSIWSIHEPAGKLTPEIMGYLPEPDFELEKFLPDVKYLHRKWNDADMFFIFNEGKDPLSTEAVMAGNGTTEVWDAFTGEIMPLNEVTINDGKIRIRLELDAWETKFIIIRK
jgi:hypothetical protein